MSVEHSGTYRLSLRAANADEEASFHVFFDGRDVTGKTTIPSTGSKDRWTSVHCDGIELLKGEQVIRLLITSGKVQLRELELTLTH